MSEAAPAKTAAKKASAKKSEHPPVATMVPEAIKSLGEKKGSSLAAIKKYIAANHKVDIERLAPFIRKYLKKAVVDGKLTQTKGTGASGSFKVAKKEKEDKPKVTKKPAAKAKKPKTPTKAEPKKVKTPKKVKSAKSPKKVTKKTPKKAAKKPATKKPAAKKTPKKVATKKAAAKKPVKK